MITINSDRGLVRIDNWDDVEETPGFTRNINPKETTLDRILGSYRLADTVVCGLSSCHHKHFRGYLVATKDGRVTNIGHDCGKTHFGVDFETLAAVFDRDMRDKERREILTAFKHRLNSYVFAVEQLKMEPKGATWLNKQIAESKHPERGLPTSISRALDEMVRARSPILKRQRFATAREIELMRETGRLATGKLNNDEMEKSRQEQIVIEEDIGRLDGLSIFYPENNVRDILIKDLEVKLKELQAVNVDATTRHELGIWAKWVGEIDLKLKTCRETVDAGRAFFDRENIAKLAELTESPADEKRVMAVARRY